MIRTWRKKKELAKKKKRERGIIKHLRSLAVSCSGEERAKEEERGECMLGMKLPQS